MDVTTFQISETVTIAAAAEELYAFIADMPRMGEISPECQGGSWVSEDRGVGALFIGSNARSDRSWQRRVRLAVVDPPRVLAWENFGDPAEPVATDEMPAARWTYRFTPVPGGTEVTESWTLLNHPLFGDFTEERFLELQARHHGSIRQTLAKLKTLFES